LNEIRQLVADSLLISAKNIGHAPIVIGD
jgi:hypothetical protein